MRGVVSSIVSLFVSLFVCLEPFEILSLIFNGREIWPRARTSSKVATVGAVTQLVEYRTRNQEVAGSTHTRSTASNLEQVANLLCAQEANSASYPQRDGK